MIIPIDTDKRDELGISFDAFAMLQIVWLARTDEADLIEQVTGWSRSKIGSIKNEIEAAGLYDWLSKEFSDEWLSMYNPTINVELKGLQGLTDDIIAHINKTTGRSFRNGKNLTKAVQRLVKAHPEKTTLTHFNAIISWAWAKWPESYRDSIGPNLFTCTPEKYMERLERAAEYWRTQNKQS